MIAVSTTWNFERHGALAPAIREIADLGFNAVELRAKGAVPDREEGGRACREGRVSCRSVHAPLTPGAWSDGDPSRQFASTDESSRVRAVAAVLTALPAAAAAGADLVVLHAGEVAIPGARALQEGWLRDIVAGKSVTEEVARALATRRERRDAHLEAAARSLFELCRAAPDVTFAMEGRLHFHEIPDHEEVELLLSDLGSRKVAYWHDTGHAHQTGRLTGIDPMAFFDSHGSRTAGVHLHDVVGTVDHLPPGGGEVDWPGVAHHAGRGMVKVLEVNGRHSPGELLAGASHLASLGLA
jgi:sugar phosphate isomerase/epimerase